MSRAIAQSQPQGGADISFVALLTAALWVTTLLVGAVGLAVPYIRPRPPAPPPPPIQAEVLNVQLDHEETLLSRPQVPKQRLESPAAPPLVEPPLPTLILPLAVADAKAPVALALPVEGPVQVVPAREAAYVRPVVQSTQTVATMASPAALTPQRLTYGQGEGRQPAPEYPRRALTAGQEGTVVVRLSVGETGRVLSAETSSPSPWPWLNEAAVRVIRDRWRFAPGGPRLYEVAIRFQLQK